MSFFKKLTKSNISEEVNKLIEKAIKLRNERCKTCEKLKEGCNAQEYEALEFIINKLIDSRGGNLIYSIIERDGLKKTQSTATIFFVTGKSMYPTIKEGDMLIITASYKINKGDIVLFYEPKTKQRVIHRVIGDDGDFLYIQGDNSQNHIDKILSDMVVGKVTSIVKKGENPEVYNFLTKAICEIKK